MPCDETSGWKCQEGRGSSCSPPVTRTGEAVTGNEKSEDAPLLSAAALWLAGGAAAAIWEKFRFQFLILWSGGERNGKANQIEEGSLRTQRAQKV